jgi:hypothetical protein
VCFVVCKTTSEQERVTLSNLYLVGAKNIDSWRTEKGNLERAFPLDIIMIPSSVPAVAGDGERLLCGLFSLGKTFRFRSLEFITGCFSGLSRSPMGNGSDATNMGSTHGRPSSSLWAMTGDSTKEFHTASDGEGRIDLPSPRRHDTGGFNHPTTTILWLETTPTAQSMTTILPCQAAPWYEPPLGEERILMMDYALI